MTRHPDQPSTPLVAVVGSFNVDHVWRCESLPVPGATLGGEYLSGPGGKGFNQAVAASRAGAATAFVCALGDDLGGHHARQLAADEGIDLRAQSADVPTGSAGIFVDAQGRNSIVVGPGANAALSADFIARHETLLAGTRVALAQLETPPEAAVAAFARTRAAGGLAVLNPAPANAQVSAELLAQADILTPNETECAALFRRLGERLDGEAIASLDSQRLHALCRDLLPGGTVVVTLGAAGCFVSHPDEVRRGDESASYRLASEPASVVDTTGAGDAFSGALAAALALWPERPFSAQVRFANRYAALSTEHHGAALAMPSREQLQARFPAGEGA